MAALKPEAVEARPSSYDWTVNGLLVAGESRLEPLRGRGQRVVVDLLGRLERIADGLELGRRVRRVQRSANLVGFGKSNASNSWTMR